MKKFFSLALLLAAASVNAATYYVDSSATGANSGGSWANAWTSMGAISGVQGGDTVYISGGPTGSSHTYSIGSGFPVVSGSSASSIVTYQIGQDSLHNGTATFSGSGTFINGSPSYFAVVGDAGDGNMHFATSGFSIILWSQSTQNNVRIGYVNFGQLAGSGGQNGNIMYMAPVNGLEFDHNYVYASAPDANAFAFIRAAGTTWDQNKIHDNSIFLPHSSSAPGQGADGIETGGTEGVSLYNNTFTAYSTSYTGGQHQDGWQDTGGSSYVKIYNNTFFNFGNYCVYGDATFGGFSHFWVYNNATIISDSAVQAGSPGGIVIGVDGGYDAGTATFDDVVIVNNIGDGYINAGTATLNNVTSHAATFTSCIVANNVSINGGGISLQGNSATVNVDNITLTTAQGPKTFVSYAANSANNNYHLISGASLIGQGANYSSYFTIDKDGNARPASGAWDIGPYEYGSTGGTTNPAPTLTVTPITQSATDVDPTTSGVQVYEGTVVQYSATATETGTGTVSWQWLYQLNGGSQVVYSSGTGAVTPVSYNYATGTGGNTYVWTLNVSDGTTSLSAQITTGVEVPPAPQTGLSFTASQAATITAPFVLASGAISQPVQTTVISQAGEATFNFSITNAGNYVIQAMVNAPGDGANSFYVNIDAQPVDPTMAWDITITTNFQSRIVSWRGTGTDTNNQFVPKIFALATGNHQVIFAGREANTYLQSFSLLQLPNSPQNLRVLPTVVNAPTFSAGP